MASQNPNQENITPQTRKAPIPPMAPTTAAPAFKLVPNNSLITKTPEEGRALAIKMAKLVVNATQPDEAIREKLRAVYANDASMLIQVTQVTATEFATIAAANNYWRK